MHISRQECPPNAQHNKHKQTYFNDILGHWGGKGKGHMQMIRGVRMSQKPEHNRAIYQKAKENACESRILDPKHHQSTMKIKQQFVQTRMGLKKFTFNTPILRKGKHLAFY